jgi:hypothetical protein
VSYPGVRSEGLRTPRRAARRARVLGRILLAAASGGVLVTDGHVATAGADAGKACGVPGYSYAGLEDAPAEDGIRARLVQLTQPRIESGQVAAWVGVVAGRGLGAAGSNAWIQIGLITLTDGVSRVFFEVNEPPAGPRFTELVTGVSVGAPYRVAVLEVASRPGWWRAWLNGRAASPPVHLAGSTRWIATAESWDGGRRVCNDFAYRFKVVAVATPPGGSWSQFVTRHRFQDPGYRVLAEKESAFVAISDGLSLRNLPG